MRRRARLRRRAGAGGFGPGGGEDRGIEGWRRRRLRVELRQAARQLALGRVERFVRRPVHGTTSGPSRARSLSIA
ncbi:hypothetical protein L599_000100002820 [Luteimonas sp. J16]|nr:hypothetical protein L599_000100002820 [Luteimonas sp. J16]